MFEPWHGARDLDKLYCSGYGRPYKEACLPKCSGIIGEKGFQPYTTDSSRLRQGK